MSALRIQGLAQCGAFGRPGRDPRGHTITVAYTAWLSAAEWKALQPVAADDAANLARVSVAAPPPLAFDHLDILRHALRHHRDRLPPSGILATHCGVDQESPDFQRLMSTLEAP